MFLEKLSALIADAVKYRSQRIQLEAMLFEKVTADLVQFLTVEMEEFAALLALQVEACFSGSMTVLPHVFKASGAVTVDYVFIDDPLVHQTLKPAIDRGLGYVSAA